MFDNDTTIGDTVEMEAIAAILLETGGAKRLNRRVEIDDSYLGGKHVAGKKERGGGREAAEHDPSADRCRGSDTAHAAAPADFGENPRSSKILKLEGQ
ncbi:hypothetical protein [Desulfococcus multivorans]|uniref:hypothetical protein n=1 Tax=Desulfococcus multivorans TaxID=897 RepID=UPI00058DDA12|nr:hypothetical protein [Desulfococcus multivorans]AOY59244.1 uncharacterized protein Dmul_24720 [Desulfococcus multivorans]AQV01466.1 hypothetical protein B2D07_12345 [Desulfococcus multivorans]MDX9819820.1 hypothetical protein [Desulfococcus multivorans]